MAPAMEMSEKSIEEYTERMRGRYARMTGSSYPFSDGTHASLVASGTEVAGFSGGGEQPLMAAIGAFEARECGSKIAAAQKGFDGSDGGRFERAEGGTVFLFVISGKGAPAVIHKLPEWEARGRRG